MESMSLPQCSVDAVLSSSNTNAFPGFINTKSEVKGYDFNEGIDYHKLLQSYRYTGFQSTEFGKAVEEINQMLKKKEAPIPEEEQLKFSHNPLRKSSSGCTIFLGYTSNLISSGIRDCIRYLVQHNMVDCIVSSAGGIEEDYIKCLAHTYVGEFSIRGEKLRNNHVNRIGNLLVPNDNYCLFEDWLIPILDTMLEEQKSENINWTPSKLIWRLGKEINNPDSVYYWCWKNQIPVFCPSLTDGSLGDMLYFHSFKNPGLRIDIVEDVRLMNLQAVHAINTGIIILGGGLVKHHICNANLMRNGADHAVYVNTGTEYDGSDAGASPDEAVSWGKIKISAKPVKIFAEASLVFPLLIAETFARCGKAPQPCNITN